MDFVVIVLTALNCYLCIRPLISKRDPDKKRLLCYNNIFLIGLLHFQIIGMFQWVIYRQEFGHWSRVISDKDFATSLQFEVYILAFILLHQSFYKIFRRRRQSKFGEVPAEIEYEELTVHKTLRVSIVLSVIALSGWLLSRPLGLSALALMMATGIGATAAGFATWVACDHPKRWAYWIFAFATAFIHFIPHLTAYGRRGMLSICFAMLWVLYYKFRSRYTQKQIVFSAVMAGLPFVLAIGAFSEARVSWPRTTGEAIENLKRVNVVDGLQQLAFLQNSSVISLWCIENHPKPLKYRYFNTIYAFVTFPIPRVLWGDKPEGLGVMIPSLARMTNYGDLNVGAGLVGHIAHEGGWPCLVVYALAFSYFMAVCDTWVFNTSNLYILIPLGSSLGELYALARGELHFFLAIMFISTTAAYFATKVVSRLYARTDA